MLVWDIQEERNNQTKNWSSKYDIAKIAIDKWVPDSIPCQPISSFWDRKTHEEIQKITEVVDNGACCRAEMAVSRTRGSTKSVFTGDWFDILAIKTDKI